MRQALFVIAVVGAAFVGGAVVNGPGFRWAQERLLLYMGLQDGGEIASIDLPPAPGEAPIADAPTVTEPTVGKRDPEVQTASASAPAAAPERRALDQGVPSPKAEPQATEPFAEAGVDQPAPKAGADESDPPALLGALVGALSQTAPPPGAADGPSQEPSAEPAPLDPSVAPTSKDAAAGGESSDWTELRDKLNAAGVSRYTIEGEPGGRVVFVCLIPLAGKQAVSQRFEAEGDDEFQAARAALRRINLWRAAQGHAEPSN